MEEENWLVFHFDRFWQDHQAVAGKPKINIKTRTNLHQFVVGLDYPKKHECKQQFRIFRTDKIY